MMSWTFNGCILWLVSTIMLTNACTYQDQPVFRGASHTIGGRNRIGSLWYYNSTYNEDIEEAKQIGYSDHYKSSAVDIWDTSKFDRVKFSIIKSGVEQMFFEFNATGSNKWNWFSRSRLIQSSLANAHQLNYHLWSSGFLIYTYPLRSCSQLYVSVDHWYYYNRYCYPLTFRTPPHVIYRHNGSFYEGDELAVYFIKDGCDDDTNPVPNLPWRNPAWDIASIDDKNLATGLYVTEGHYDMATTVISGREIGCGAQRQIWFDDTLPENDGFFHSKKVCMTDRYNEDLCQYTFTVDVKNSGDQRVYNLSALSNDQYDNVTESVAYCFDIAGLTDPCTFSSPAHILDLESYRPSNTHDIRSENYMIEDWYYVKPYQLLRWSPQLDLPRCGAESQIWMNGTLPVADGRHHARQLCTTNRTSGDTCSNDTKFTFIKNCTTHLLYYLPTPIENSAYCFDLPSDSNEPPPAYLPSRVAVKYELLWIDVDNGYMAENPSLRFICNFDKDDNNVFYYVIYFQMDGHYVNLDSDLVVQDSAEAYLTEETIIAETEFTAGVTITCSVGVRSSPTGRTGSLVTSDGFYAGIKILNHSVSVERGSSGSVYYQQTVPFGCRYSPFIERITGRCALTVYLLKTSTENTCTSNTIQHYNKCVKELPGLTKRTNINSDTWTPPIDKFDVVPVDNELGAFNLVTRQFAFKFQTMQSQHSFWSDSQSDEVLVNVSDATDSKFWKGKICYAYCDPHMMSFDGMAYELQYAGTFTLFKSEALPVEVHVKITSCYRWRSGRPFCACGLVARAGKDVFQIDTCNGNREINYKSCEDGVLKVYSKTSKEYKIYLPTGAIVRVRIRGRSGLQDIDVTPTIHEYKGQISGLCGNFDGDPYNDCVSKGDTTCKEPYSGGRGYRYHPNTFTQSYKLSIEDSLLKPQIDTNSLEPYPRSNQMCVCPRNGKELEENESVFSSIEDKFCSYRQYSSCTDTKKEVKCTFKSSRLIRKRRYVDVTEENISDHDITKRSASVNETEAIQLCTEDLTTVTNEACSDIGINASVTEIDNCAADLMMTGDGNWTRFAIDRSESACLETLEKNTTLQEENPEISNIIRNSTCPNNCSERGSCSNGTCVCEKDFASEDCSYNLNTPISIFGLDNDGLCDGCHYIVIEGLEFLSDRNYTCQFSGRVTPFDGIRQPLEATNVSAEYQSLFETICSLPEGNVSLERKGTEYNVSVAMDGYDFSDVINFVVINAACQYYVNTSGDITFFVQEGFCLINGTCHPEGTYKENALCLECKPEQSINTWSNSSNEDCVVSDKDTTDPEQSINIILAVSAVVGSVSMCLLIGLTLCICKQKNKRHQVKNDLSISDPCDDIEVFPSIAWPNKYGTKGIIQTETKKTGRNITSTIPVQTEAVNDVGLESEIGIRTAAKSSAMSNDQTEDTDIFKQKNIDETTSKWVMDLSKDYIREETKIETNESMTKKIFLQYGERLGNMDKVQKETYTPDFILFYDERNVSNGKEIMEEATNVDTHTRQMYDTDCNGTMTKHTKTLDPSQMKTERKKRKKRKKKHSSHEQKEFVSNTIEDRADQPDILDSRIEDEKPIPKHPRSFNDDEGVPQQSVAYENEKCEPILPKRDVDFDNNETCRTLGEDGEEWDDIIVIDDPKMDIDNDDSSGKKETATGGLKLLEAIVQDSTPQGNGKRKKKRKRKKVAPETQKGASAFVPDNQGEGVKLKSKKKKKSKAKKTTGK